MDKEKAAPWQAALSMYSGDNTVNNVDRTAAGTSRSAATASGVVIGRHGATAVITLDRADKLNAINSAMRQTVADAMHDLADDPRIYGLVIRAVPARAFSAGGDILELYAQELRSPGTAARNLADEYALVWAMECFNKPTVSFIDGPAIGSGVGLTLYGTHRVAGPDYRFQMPETTIGFFPDDGLAHVFARMPRQIGVYLGLTGRALGRADALRLGLVTHCIAPEHFAEIQGRYADADPIDPLLDDRHVAPDPAPIDHYAEVIARCFAADTVEDIIARLAAEPAHKDWCAGVAADLAVRSPLALKVTLRHIRLAAHLDLRQTLAIDHRIACRLLAAPDFSAAVRCRLIEKTGRPRWQPDRLADVTETMLDDVFAPMPGHELVLPTLQEL